jgi:tetratricopeptide (TPR) repeat protein
MRRIVLAHLLAAFVVGFGVTAWAQGEAATAPGAAAAMDAAVSVKVRKLISEGGYYYSVGQFQKAVETADAALRLDPNSASAAELKKISQQAIVDRDQKNWVREERKGFYQGIDEIGREMAVPRGVIIDEGPRWPMIKKRGATVYGPVTEIEEQNREINSKLETIVVTADFKSQPLKDAVAFLANQSKLNIQVDPRAKVGDKPAPDAEMTFKAQGLKLRSAVNWPARLNKLTWTIRDQVVFITDAPHLEEMKVTNQTAKLLRSRWRGLATLFRRRGKKKRAPA